MAAAPLSPLAINNAIRFKSSSLLLTPAADSACLISSAPLTPWSAAACPLVLFLKFSMLFKISLELVPNALLNVLALSTVSAYCLTIICCASFSLLAVNCIVALSAPMTFA